MNPSLKLRTARLRLRKIVASDAKDLFRFRSDPDVQRFNGGPMTQLADADELIERISKGIEDGTLMEWALTLEDGRAFGYLGLSNWSKEQKIALVTH